jgi:hypothetical protein
MLAAAVGSVSSCARAGLSQSTPWVLQTKQWITAAFAMSLSTNLIATGRGRSSYSI